MENVSELIYEQLNKIIRNKDTYFNKGYSIKYDLTKEFFSIKYNKCLYKVKVSKINKDYYWHLSPYNHSYFTTKITNPKSFDVVLFAIKDNECYKNPLKCEK